MRCLPDAPTKYNAEPPDQVSRVKKHPAMLGLLEMWTLRQAEKLGGELAAISPAALEEWNRHAAKALAPRLARLASWTKKAELEPQMRVALEGLLAIGATSATVNLGIKPLAHRRRPERPDPAPFEARLVPMPESTSFPSGHSASAFAFAYTVGRHYPGLAVPIRLLASAVAYSRVHTGVHYPGDVVLGSIVGAGTSAMVAAACDRAYQSPRRECVVPGRLL